MANMVEVIEPFYPKAGNGRWPYPLETMLRIHCMQHWYNLSDGAMRQVKQTAMNWLIKLSLTLFHKKQKPTTAYTHWGCSTDL